MMQTVSVSAKQIAVVIWTVMIKGGRGMTRNELETKAKVDSASIVIALLDPGTRFGEQWVPILLDDKSHRNKHGQLYGILSVNPAVLPTLISKKAVIAAVQARYRAYNKAALRKYKRKKKAMPSK